MNHGSFFSGIGGFDLAAQWMGWDNIFHCEIELFPRKILQYYWPKSISYEDIRKTDFSVHRGKIDIVSGGFPCQPFSLAGKRKGTEDPRNLWPEYYRAIREIQPRYVVGENVYGLINWKGGLVFDQVQDDLENEGYEVAPVILPACSTGAPHKRERIWFVAYNNGSRQQWNKEPQKRLKHFDGRTTFGKFNSHDGTELTSDTKIIGLQQSRNTRERRTGFEDNNIITSNSNSEQRPERRLYSERPETSKRYAGSLNSWFSRGNWQNFPTQSPVCGGDDGLSTGLDPETILEAVGRKVNSRFKPFGFWRNESIKAYGNAIVPQVAYEIFKIIQKIES